MKTRVELPDGKSHLTDLDIQTLRWLSDFRSEDELKKLPELDAEAIAKQPQPTPQVALEATKKASDQGDAVPTKCHEPGCGKEFKRLCDLTKHERNHFRP